MQRRGGRGPRPTGAGRKSGRSGNVASWGRGFYGGRGGRCRGAVRPPEDGGGAVGYRLEEVRGSVPRPPEEDDSDGDPLHRAARRLKLRRLLSTGQHRAAAAWGAGEPWRVLRSSRAVEGEEASASARGEKEDLTAQKLGAQTNGYLILRGAPSSSGSRNFRCSFWDLNCK